MQSGILQSDRKVQTAISTVSGGLYDHAYMMMILSNNVNVCESAKCLVIHCRCTCIAVGS